MKNKKDKGVKFISEKGRLFIEWYLKFYEEHNRQQKVMEAMGITSSAYNYYKSADKNPLIYKEIQERLSLKKDMKPKETALEERYEEKLPDNMPEKGVEKFLTANGLMKVYIDLFEKLHEKPEQQKTILDSIQKLQDGARSEYENQIQEVGTFTDSQLIDMTLTLLTEIVGQKKITDILYIFLQKVLDDKAKEKKIEASYAKANSNNKL